MRAVPVLMYHHVSPAPGLVTVSPETFAAHMALLARQGYTTLSAARFLEFLQGRAAVPKKSVVITFDDGYLDNYLYAYPVLKRLGLHAIIFAVTGWIAEGAARTFDTALPSPNHSACKAAIREGRADSVMLRWSEIELMQASGAVEFHSHSHHHVRWDQLYPQPSAAAAQLHTDLECSMQSLITHLGKQAYQLCWPWGIYTAEYQDIALRIGFSAQYSVEPQPNLAGKGATHIGRIAIKSASAAWLARRLWLYASAARANFYNRVSGKYRVYG